MTVHRPARHPAEAIPVILPAVRREAPLEADAVAAEDIRGDGRGFSTKRRVSDWDDNAPDHKSGYKVGMDGQQLSRVFC